MEIECAAACAGTKNAGTAQAAMNTKCPVTGEAVDPASTAEFKGTKVGFCCDNCIPKWDKLSDADKQAKLDKAK